MKQAYCFSTPIGSAAHATRLAGYVLVLLALLLARPARAQTTTFGVTGNPESYIVPAGVTRLVVVATGAYNGATVRATVAVTPGETLTVVVGNHGQEACYNGCGGGGTGGGIPLGYNGGGSSSAVGGGATDLRRTGPSTGDYLSGRNALLVAGGGGSGCYGNSFGTSAGGAGGTPNGGNGTGTAPGTGATQTSVGTSTGGAASNDMGGAGTGGGGYSIDSGGGSGGGGYYGGGSGTSSGGSGTGGGTDASFRSGGGGGGSSWVMAGSTAVSYSTSAAADGVLTITPARTATPVLTAPADGSTVGTATPTYTGTAPAGSTVRLYVDGAGLPPTTADGSGNFSLTQPTALGSHTVYATAQAGSLPVSLASATNSFTFAVPPITGLSPTSGVAGTLVTLSGTNLTGASAVTVNGVAVTPTNVTANSLTFVVPAGASATQSITVTTPIGTSPPRTDFTVLLQVASTSPAANARRAPTASSAVALTFTEPVVANSVGVAVYSAQLGGLKAGTVTVAGSTARFAARAGTPRTNFKPGETVSVSVPYASSAGGLTARRRVYQFTTAVDGPGRGIFNASTAPAVGANPTSVAVGDIDGDGDLDLLTANSGTTTVSVRLNGGDATGSNTGIYSGGSDPVVGTTPRSIALGDVDGDGDLDLLAAVSGSNAVSVRLNGGTSGSNTGVFSGGGNVSVGTSPRSVAVGDVDGDGDLDFLTANYSTNSSDNNSVSVRLNQGRGFYYSTNMYYGSNLPVGSTCTSVALGDVDGDGDLDLFATTLNSNAANGRLNGGDASGSNAGTFAGGNSPAVGSGPRNVALGDVDGDGDLDLLTANSGTNTVSVRLNGGDASGSNTGVYSGGSDPVVGTNPYSVTLADVDSDGDLDLITANYGSNTVSVRLNGGDASGSSTGVFAGGSDPVVGTNPYSVATGDVDGDGDLDLLVANYGSNSVSVLLNQAPPPAITSFTPISGPVGTSVTIRGTGLVGATAITFTSSGGTATATPTGYVVASDGASITGITVPIGLAPGAYTVTVTTPGGLSNGLTFTVVSTSALTAVAPTPGGLGQAITLTGTNLGSPTALTINGANALGGIVSNDGSTLVVRVPLGAAAAGIVSITTAGGTATSPFSVLAAPGNALAFDGVNDYVRPAGTLPATGEFTLEAWVNPTAFPNPLNALVLADDFPGGAMHCQFYGNQLGFTINGNNPADVVSAVALPLGRWAHVAVVYSASAKTVQFYLNGVLVTTSTYTTAGAISATAYSVGAWRTGGGVQRAFTGRLDELRLYSAALTPAQVQADMVSTAPAVPASLALDLNFDQGTPATASTGANAPYTTLYDLSSNATLATLTGFALASGNTSSNYVQSYALVVPTATAATSQTRTSFIATWAAPANGTVTSYLLDVSTTPDFTSAVAGSPFMAPASATSYGVTGLMPSTTYYYRVRALNTNLAQPDQGAYSTAAAATTAAPLPVTLTAFTAVAQGSAAVRLAWATASETNSARFEVERSADGVAFGQIGQVAAAGTTPAAHTYALTDAALPAGASVLYYRLRQVDLDGSFTYSPVRTVALGGAAGLSLYPNPTDGAATLTGAEAGAAVQVFDALGRVVGTAVADATGTAALPAGLPAGVYVVRSGAHALRLTVR